MNRLDFLREFARAPVRTGAVTASSRRLVDVLIAAAKLDSATVVMELGPGTGAVTERLVTALQPDARFLALEINPAFAAATRRRCPEATVIVDDAANARRHLDRLGVDGCDAVISGLPWASFGPDRQELLLGAVRDILRPGGRFVTFAYLQGLLLPTAHRFERRLRHIFRDVRTTPTVWRNLPPAFAYVARK